MAALGDNLEVILVVGAFEASLSLRRSGGKETSKPLQKQSAERN
jgi:hypothetical protein